jgi:lipopolysaccharide/colanic/teichoic acid biosynthesis glycosyltransferase
VVYGLEAVASRCSHAELVQNPEDLDLLLRTRLSPPYKTRLLGNGVDLERYRPRPELRDQARLEMGVSEADVVVGFVGRLVLEKGLRELFEAAAALGERCVVVAVGPDDMEKSDALAAGHRAEAAAAGVRFLGMRDDLDLLYQGMDLFVLPSYREGFPRAAMEAAASGLPIVATDIRGCRQVVEHGATGLLVPAKDTDALAGAIDQLIADPGARARMGVAARERAVRDFDERVVVARVLATYDHPPRRRGARTSRAKRILDVVISAVALVVLSPLFAAVALLVRARMGAPVLFRQQRPGLDGRIFEVIKFRTMTSAVDGDGRPHPDHERLTRLGRTLRTLSLDELPELLNVLRGEMSLVGPRPLLPEYLGRYDATQARRHEVRPGLTGWAQVNGRNATTWPERLDNDVWYVDHWSLGLDLRIMWTTAVAVLRRTGISAEGEATMPPFQGA